MDRVGLSVQGFMRRMRDAPDKVQSMLDLMHARGLQGLDLDRFACSVLRVAVESMFEELEDLEAALSMSTNCPQSSGGMQFLRGGIFRQAAENDG